MIQKNKNTAVSTSKVNHNFDNAFNEINNIFDNSFNKINNELSSRQIHSHKYTSTSYSSSETTSYTECSNSGCKTISHSQNIHYTHNEGELNGLPAIEGVDHY